jgi:hypothetical protein
MTSWSRAVLGALLGAVLTLFVHPTSRSFVGGPFLESRRLLEQRKDSLPETFPKELPVPQDDISASLWIHVAAEQLRTGVPLSTAQLHGLIQIAAARAKSDPNNAFWKMSEAVFSERLGNHDAARLRWMESAKCITYNDFQSRYLLKVRDSLGQTASSNSWQFAYCYRLRSLAFSSLIEEYAKSIINTTSRSSPSDLNLRFATMVNGGLLRDGSRNLQIMEKGISIVELASHPRELREQASIKRLLIAHSEFKEAFKKIGNPEAANRVEQAYNENDGWSALTRREDTDEKVATLTLSSALWPNLPGVLIQCALLGGLLWLIGIGMLKIAKVRPSALSPIIGGLAVVIPISVYALTHSWLALAATTMCCAFIVFSPRSPRTRLPEDLGPLFALAVTLLAFAFVGLTAVMFLSRTLPVVASASAFDPQLANLVDFTLAGGLGLMIVASLFLFSPLWAIAQHIPTSHVLAMGFRTMGAIVGALSLVLAVGGTPFCIYLEKENLDTFRMLLENEPVYYVRQ